MTTLSQILHYRIVAIIRGARPADVLNIAHALQQGGVNILEVTLNSPKALSVIEQLAEETDGILVGAGTVLDAEAARAAISAGARFLISPALDTGTIRMARRYGIVSIPGAYTPSEILEAHVSGGDIIKVFPATSAEYVRNIGGPLPYIPLMPTGGVHLHNIADFDKAGAVAFGIGGALVDTTKPVTPEYLHRLTTTARSFVEAITHP